MHAPLLPNVSDALFASLGHLGFQHFAPHPRLLPWVQCYWVAQQAHLPEGSVSETVYPDGGTTLIFNFARGDFPDIIFNATHSTSQMQFPGRVNRMGIRFHPGGAFQLLGVDMQYVAEGDSAADELAPPSLLQLRAHLAETPLVNQRLNMLDRWLLTLADKADNGLIQRLLPRLLLTQESFDQLSTQVPISRRQLERKFQQEVGFSPIQLKQLHRIKLARTLISRRPEQPLSHVGQDTGFYDQAHFIRQFQKITGLTPNQYRQKKMSQKYNPPAD